MQLSVRQRCVPPLPLREDHLTHLGREKKSTLEDCIQTESSISICASQLLCPDPQTSPTASHFPSGLNATQVAAFILSFDDHTFDDGESSLMFPPLTPPANGVLGAAETYPNRLSRTPTEVLPLSDVGRGTEGTEIVGAFGRA